MGRRLLPLEVEETAALIRISSTREPLQLAFGAGGCALDTLESAWALPLILEWRGRLFSDGAGI